jgi:membrane protease YdiL (CAAX protease family)
MKSRAPITRGSYFTAILVIYISIYAQYVFPWHNPIAGVLFAYGVPILWITRLCGADIIRRAFTNSVAALHYGMGAFGVFALAGILASAGVFYIISAIDPRALNLLHRPIPLLHLPPHLDWIMVWVSFLIVGPAEEYIFRGFVFGRMLRLYPERHWLLIALLSSLLFAAAHLYYILIFGIASLVPLTEIITIGMALAVTYYLSGGNLLIPALIHGAFDASGFVAAGISPEIGIALRQAMILAGVLVAFSFFARRPMPKRRPSPGEPRGTGFIGDDVHPDKGPRE